jgi:parvulin-like peptidyl-prolyl isomerase
MYRKSLFVLVIALLILAASGCKKEEDRVLATVGNHEITVAEWEKMYRPTKLGTPEEMMVEKRAALDLVITETLMLNEAEARGYAENEGLKKMLEDRKRVLVVNQLYKVEIVDKVQLDDSEVQRIYEMSSEELDLKRIHVESEEEALRLKDELDAGTEFDMLAAEHSLDATTKEKGGSLGWVRWGRLTDPLTEAAYKLEVGQISAPVQDNMGWHILLLVGRRAVENMRAFEEERKRIENRLEQKTMKEMADAYLNSLKERIAITYNEDIVKSVAEKAPQERVNPWAPAPLPTVTEEERELVLVTTSKGEWTVGKILDFAAKVPPRTSVGTPEGLKQWVDMLILQEELVVEALGKGLDRVDEVKDEIDHAYQVEMVNLLHRDEIELKAEPTEEDIGSAFEANKDKYAVPEKNWVSLIVTATEDQAKEVLNSLKRGADFETLAKEKSIHPSKRRGGNMGIVYEQRDPEISNAAKGLKVNRLSEPVAVKDGWAVLKVTKREEKKMRTFEEAKRLVQRDLRYENLGRIEDSLHVELREKYPVSVNEALLKQVGKKREDELLKREEEKREAT